MCVRSETYPGALHTERLTSKRVSIQHFSSHWLLATPVCYRLVKGGVLILAIGSP